MLGVLKAGGVYVPMDVANPARRVGPHPRAQRAALGPGRGAARACCRGSRAEASARRPAIGWLDDAAAPRTTLSGPRSPAPTCGALLARAAGLRRLGVDDAAHILFTSGSTGEPKGVVITHANVLHFLEWAVRYFGIGPDDRHSGHPPLHFDLSTFDIYGTLAAGAQLHLVPPRAQPAARQAGGVHPPLRAHPVVLGTVDPRRYMAKFDVVRARRLPVPRAPALVRRGASRPRPSSTGCSGSRTSRSPTCTGPPRPPSPAATTRCPAARQTSPRRSRSAPPVRGRGAAGARRGAVARAPGRDRRPLHRRRGPEPGLLAGPGEDGAAFHRRSRRGRRTASTRPATWRRRATDGLVYFLGAPTRRSRAAATGSSSARSRRR